MSNHEKEREIFPNEGETIKDQYGLIKAKYYGKDAHFYFQIIKS